MALSRLLTDTYGLSKADIESKAPLFSSGLLDSFVLVELIVFLERSQNIKIKASALRLENFDSIENMVALVASLRPEAV